MNSPSEIEVQDHSADYYVNKRYKSLGMKYHSMIIKEMMKHLHGKVLDVGCGTGIIHDLYPGWDIMGIDVSSGMLRHHRGKHKLASATAIPFPRNSFDNVVCRSVLHHVPRVEKALLEIKRVLKPGGRLVCWETNKSWLAQLIRRFTQHGDRFSEFHTSFDDLPSLIRKHFPASEITVRYQGFLAYPLLGFPDIIDFSPVVGWAFDLLVKIDEFLSKVPFVRRLSFAVMIEVKK